VGEQVAVEDMSAAIDHAALTSAELGFLDEEAGKITSYQNILGQASFGWSSLSLGALSARTARPTGARGPARRRTSRKRVRQNSKVVSRSLRCGSEGDLGISSRERTMTIRAECRALRDGQAARLVDTDAETLTDGMPFDYVACFAAATEKKGREGERAG
jgi:hypothetical protein